MTLRFNEDGTFRVLQMADIQDKPEVNRDTIRLIEAAIRETKPDLVVLTGDQIRGYDPAYIDTFLRRRGEKPGARVRLITEIEARIYGVKRRYPEAAELAERMADRLEDRGQVQNSAQADQFKDSGTRSAEPSRRFCSRLWMRGFPLP